MNEISGDHPLRLYFLEALHEALAAEVGLNPPAEVEGYLSSMLLKFLNFDGIFAIRNAQGMPVHSVVEMLAEGDIRQNADSFERERQVHQHIGDFLLFWSGFFPEFFAKARAVQSNDLYVDVIRQGQFSYHVVSTFDYGKYSDEAPIFRRLSTEFDAYREGLNLMRANFKGLSPDGWGGLQA